MTGGAAGVLALGLVLGTLVIMASRTLAPVKEKPRGAVELELRLPLLQRALSQKVNVVSVCAIVVVGGGALTSQRIISPMVGLLALVVMVGLILRRQTLVLTSQGVLIHNAAFRQWKEFEAVSIRPGKLVLRSSTRLASVSLYLPSGTREQVAGIAQRHVGPPGNRAPTRPVARANGASSPRAGRRGRRNRG